jgi:hypothetical protein
MENYINQLLEEMEIAKNNLPPKVNYALLYPNHPALIYGLDYVVEWEMAPDWKMEDLFGIKKEQLPVAEKLTEFEIEKLNKGILDLWFAFNTIVEDLDERIPQRDLYIAFRNSWEEKTIQYMPDNIYSLDFCEYSPEHCIWNSEFCPCKNLDVDDLSSFEFNYSIKNTNSERYDIASEDDLPF